MIGEFISIGVAFSWTITALCIEYASKRIGSISVNFLRLSLAFVFTGILLLVTTGNFLPTGASHEAWLWMSVSGLIGYVFGDFCLFYSYVVIGSRFGQLFMTLAPIAAAISGNLLLGESMSIKASLGMAVTISGIALSIFSRGTSGHLPTVKIPLKGVLLGVGAGIGQGVGLVFSKYGMSFYLKSAEHCSEQVKSMIPFAAGEIRMITGALSFLIILSLTRQLGNIGPAVRDKKAALSVLMGTIFGPFLGVSFSLMAVQYTASGIASTLMAITPVLIIPFAINIQKQKVTFWEIAGAFISVAGVALFFI